MRASDDLDDHQDILEAEETWRRCLLGELPHPGKFEQRIYRLGEIAEFTNLPASLSPRQNVYWMRAVDATFVDGDRGLMMTYTKMARLVIVGLISEENPEHWGGHRFRVRRGALTIRSSFMPDYFLEFMFQRADLINAGMRAISDSERAKIRRVVDEAGSAFYDSDTFAAMVADERLRSPLDDIDE